MTRFASLPNEPVLGDVFKRFPEGARPLFEYHDILLRGPSPLSVAQREMLAAYVSGLNACQYCTGAHRIIAEVHGVKPELLEHLVQDTAGAGLDPKMRPLLDYVRMLTLTPSKIVDADAQAVFAAGWDEQALFHAVSVCALFNFMNRIVEGCGITTDSIVQADQRARHAAAMAESTPYQNYGRRLGLF